MTSKRIGNKSDLVRELGVSIPTINAWLLKGMPYITKGDKSKAYEFDIDAVKAWREQHTGKASQSPTSEAAEQRARLLKHRANLAALEEAELCGKLVRSEAVYNEAFAQARGMREAFRGIADTLSAELAVETDEVVIYNKISDAVRGVLDGLIKIEQRVGQAYEDKFERLAAEHGAQGARLLMLGIDLEI